MTDNTDPKWVPGVNDIDINYERGEQSERRSTLTLKERTYLKQYNHAKKVTDHFPSRKLPMRCERAFTISTTKNVAKCWS